MKFINSVSSVQSLSHVRLFATPWTTACQASLSTTNSRSPPKPLSIESVMPSDCLILCRPLLLLPPIPPSIRVSSHHVAEGLEFQLQHQSFQWTPKAKCTFIPFPLVWVNQLCSNFHCGECFSSAFLISISSLTKSLSQWGNHSFHFESRVPYNKYSDCISRFQDWDHESDLNQLYILVVWFMDWYMN